MRAISLILLVGSLFLVGACAGDETPNEPLAGSAELSPEQLGELGARIAEDPDRAGQILAEHGLDRDSFERAIREVTEDAEESKRYADAFEQVRG